MGTPFDPVSYKEELKKTWDEKAEIYQERFVSKRIGPFQSLEKLVSAAAPKKGERVLDVGTGTGIVALEVAKRVGDAGKVVGIDLSPGPLAIARRTAPQNSSGNNHLQFLEMDAEDLKFPDRSFDLVVSQFALMLFPDSQKALREMKRMLARKGRLALSVHGSEENVPYFSVMRRVLMKYVPDIIPAGRPDPHRFGEPDLLRRELERSGFRDIGVATYTYLYSPRSFEEYWDDFMQSTPGSMRVKVEGLDPGTRAKIRQESEAGASRFLKDGGRIEFPWQVLIASARP